ncbi:unnamed protein product [Orchesella dallaii]|uniref:Protein sleepless n=1 Tax=Orchesella dallaii TaxID=48710 RepID=A0ABP1RDM2_9HEXA
MKFNHSNVPETASVSDRDYCIEIIYSAEGGIKRRHCSEDYAYEIRKEDWTDKSGACYDLGNGVTYCFCNDKDDCNKDGIKGISKGSMGSLFINAWSLTSVFSVVIACLLYENAFSLVLFNFMSN